MAKETISFSARTKYHGANLNARWNGTIEVEDSGYFSGSVGSGRDQKDPKVVQGRRTENGVFFVRASTRRASSRILYLLEETGNNQYSGRWFSVGGLFNFQDYEERPRLLDRAKSLEPLGEIELILKL